MLLNSFSSYSSGSSDLSSVLGGVSVEELDKVKESKTTIKSVTTSYSSAQDVPLTDIISVSGSGMIIGAFGYFSASGSDLNQDYFSHFKATLDDETMMHTGSKFEGYSGGPEGCYFGFSLYDKIKPTTISSSWANMSTYGMASYDSRNSDKSYGELISDYNNNVSSVLMLEAPIIFHSNFKIQLGLAHSGNNSGNVLHGNLTVRYVLDWW